MNDVNVLIEVRHFLESKHCFDEYALNPKVMTLSPKVFLELCDETIRPSEFTGKEVARQFGKKLLELKIETSKYKSLLDDFSPKGLVKFVVENEADTISELIFAMKSIKPTITEKMQKLFGLFKKN